MKIELNSDDKKKNESIEIELDDQDVSDEVKQQLKETGHAHIHKTGDDGEEVDIDIDKKSKKIEVNIDKEGKKQKVNIGLGGIKVESEDGKNVNIKFLPIILVVLAFVLGVLFFFYKVIELIFGSLF